MSTTGKIYVVGHRNPDTDSICSAIAYSDLRRRQGLSRATAARVGNINLQTQFVLDDLNVALPELLSDIHPRVKDVVGDEVVSIHETEPMSKAVELYHKHHIRMLPVVDDQDRAKGLLVLKQATEFFLVPSNPTKMRRVTASVSSIKSCLGAEGAVLFDPDRVDEMVLSVGARDAESFKRWIADSPADRTIIITGDRPEIKAAAIESGIRLLIISGVSEAPDKAMLAAAESNGVSVLLSSYDTANCVWLTRMAMPVGHLITEDYLEVGPNDLLDDLRLKLSHGDQTGAIVTDGNKRVIGVASKSHLIKKSPHKLILVDHNELSQAVPGAEQVDILEVIDHHRLGNFHTDQPIRFINQPLGSTCSLVATLYQQAGLTPDAKIAGLMLAGLLSDTVILKSPTATQIDKDLIPWLEGLSGLDHKEFGSRMFAAGSLLASGIPPNKLITTDFKEYKVDAGTLGLGQIEVVSFHTFYQRQEELSDELHRLRAERGYLLAALLVTDIVKETSLLVTSGPKELPYIIGYPQQDKDLYRLAGVLSRKKQLVPHLLKAFKEM